VASTLPANIVNVATASRKTMNSGVRIGPFEPSVVS